MINFREYLQDDLVENYCLGTASPEDEQYLLDLCAKYPEIRNYLYEKQKAVELFVQMRQRKAPQRSKRTILNAIQENQKLDRAPLADKEQLTEFIQLNRHTHLEKWLQVLDNVEEPVVAYENIHFQPLFQSPEKQLLLVWAKQLIPTERHPDIDERFILLEGSIECHIDGEVFYMEQGGYMKIPPHLDHKVLVTSSKRAKAVLSRVKIN
ncbi:MAG: cupin domain-containing protein [Bacteroidota bacterium]